MHTRLILGAAISALLASTAHSMAEDVKVGILLSLTGPTESTAPFMAQAAEMAVKEVTDSGKFLEGKHIVSVRADATCVDSTAATAAAERLVTSERIVAMVGADCSGASIAVLNNVAIPNGVVMISPISTSPALSTVDDKGLFFRTVAPSVREAQVMSDLLMEKDIKTVAVTFSNTDYGKGISAAFAKAYEAAGGKVLANLPHQDGASDYSAEVGALAAAASSQRLVVFGYPDQGGIGMIRASLESGAFDKFALGDGMFTHTFADAIGKEIGGTIGLSTSAEGPGADAYKAFAEKNGLNPTAFAAAQTYDAMALILLAMQAAKSTERSAIKDKVLEVANGPGEPILAGELAKGLEILSNGGEIDYVGGTAVELIGPGESAGSYREYLVEDGKDVTQKFR